MNQRLKLPLWLLTCLLLCFVPTAGATMQDPAPEQKKAENDPFTPEPAPPLPTGMTGSDTGDPRFRLRPGLYDAEAVAKGLKHISLLRKPDAFQLGASSTDDPKITRTLGMLGISNPGAMPKAVQTVRAQLAFANSDLAFQGRYAFMGNFYGVNIYDIAILKRSSVRYTMTNYFIDTCAT